VVLPIQKMFIATMDTFQKIQGSMIASLYTMLGSYYVLQSLMGGILDLVIKMLVTLAAIIVGLWITPFTWPAAASMSAVFVGIAIPLSIIAVFMKDVLKVKSGNIPRLRCFDENTPIALHNGKFAKIKNVKVGDLLANGSRITAKLKLLRDSEIMYDVNGILVSGGHKIYNGKDFVSVKDANYKPVHNYNNKYIYCLNTTNKIITIGNMIFSDWDEMNDSIFENIKKSYDVEGWNDIYKISETGYVSSSMVKCKNGKYVSIDEIKLGTELDGIDNFVYGKVEMIDNLFRNNIRHILTTTGKFRIKENDKIVNDYNYNIDKFII